ncbi:MAG: S8 family serine peptidase, partial [Myxococcales bacterium]|nr:S8 family serine peptidase [Myxococcales bacterium]
MANIPPIEPPRAYASALSPTHAEASNPAAPAPERTTPPASTTSSLTLTVPLELSIHVGQPRPTAPALLAREPAPEPEATGLAAIPPTTQSVLVELTLDDAAEASAEVRRAADELGLLTRGWRVTGPIDTRAPRRCIELLAPADTDMRGGWDVAHALRERLAARPELAATAEPELALELSAPEAGARGELEGTHGRDHDLAVEPNWHLDGIRARAAWALSRGASVRIGHPDTGTTAHPILAHATILADEGLNLLELDQAPTDPLTGLGQPGHGTATSSLMVSPDGPPDGVSGLAPAAELVPIRVTDSVVILAWQARLARAIDHAVDHGCHVISMSLGGLPGIRLRRAVERAHDRGVIVVAAAGNVVQFVVWPAAYPQVIAVAATGPGDRAWSG